VLLGEVAPRPEDCAGVALLVAARSLVRVDCPAMPITQRDLLHRGAHAIYLESDGVRVERAAALIGERPWAARGRPPINDDGSEDLVGEAAQ
jgi:hypothetical protein